MVNVNKLKRVPSSFFILCLITILHTPYYHFHITSNNTHTSDHEHHSGPSHNNSDNHSYNSHTILSKTEAFKPGNQDVMRHLHVTRELYRSRKNPQSEPEKYNSFAIKIIRPALTNSHTITGTLTDFHKTKYGPESSKTYSGLSPPVA